MDDSELNELLSKHSNHLVDFEPKGIKKMSKVICIAGESGSGKTTSLRNLDPESTYIIDADRKGLSWDGWKEKFNEERKNYLKSSDPKIIKKCLQAINEKAPKVKTVVIDTLNLIMIDDEFSRMKEKGYDKWMDLAYSVWELITDAYMMRDDLTIIFMAHTQTERDEVSGQSFTRLKTSGKKLDKIVLESKFSTVLIARNVEKKYFFETNANNSTAKSPMGAFSDDEFEIPNDVVLVLEKLKRF